MTENPAVELAFKDAATPWEKNWPGHMQNHMMRK
jgi:hypothetical protein